MNDTIRMRIMQIMASHRGRENAIPRKELAGKLRRFAIDIADRQLRDIYSTLPICSCNDGIFIPRTPEEVQKYREYLKRAWLGQHHHYTKKYMPLYVAEAAFKYNNRTNHTNEVFTNIMRGMLYV